MTKVKCDECFRTFANSRGLQQHKTKKHPYVPPPPPKREIQTAPNEYEDHSLLNGRKVQLGDVIWIGRKAVIVKLTKTEGSNDVDVTLRLTKKWWSETEIS
jgi:hypothetical protein